KVRVAVSLGPQRALVPNVIGKSGRTAELIVERRGLEVGTIAVLHLPDLPPDQVVAQSPSANAGFMTSPKVSLLVSAPVEAQSYLMPNFVGMQLADASKMIEEAGLHVAKVGGLETATSNKASTSLIVTHQQPAAGARVSPGMTVSLDIAP